MGVLVCYDDFTYDVINDYHLDYLLAKGCIIGYDKSGDWVRSEEENLPPEGPTGKLVRFRELPRQKRRYLPRR